MRFSRARTSPSRRLGADGLTSSFVFVVRCHILDPGVKPDPVVLRADEFEFGFKLAGVGDLLQVRPFALDVTEQGLDPRLVLGLSG